MLVTQFLALLHCNVEATSDVLSMLGVEPRVFVGGDVLDKFVDIPLHAVIPAMDTSFVYSDEGFVGALPELIVAVQRVQHLLAFLKVGEIEEVFK